MINTNSIKTQTHLFTKQIGVQFAQKQGVTMKTITQQSTCKWQHKTKTATKYYIIIIINHNLKNGKREEGLTHVSNMHQRDCL